MKSPFGRGALMIIVMAMIHYPSVTTAQVTTDGYYPTKVAALSACSADLAGRPAPAPPCRFTDYGTTHFPDANHLDSQGQFDGYWDAGVLTDNFRYSEIVPVNPVVNATPGKNAGSPPPCNCAGDPINLGTGNEYRDEQDADLGELSFHRYYNSQPEVVTTFIGVHWRHSFDRSLSAFAATGSTITQGIVLRPDGKQVVFNLQGSAWVTDADVADRLTNTTDGSGNVTGWTYFNAATRDNENYDAFGRLISIVDTNQLVTSLTYNPSTQGTVAAGLLASITDAHGRQLTFTYNSNNLVATVTLPDGGVLTYGYDTNGHLTSVIYPDQQTRQYLYNESNLTSGASLPNVLTGDIDETGARFSSVGYDNLGHAISSVLAGGADSTQVAYNTDGTTTVTYPTGAQATLVSRRQMAPCTRIRSRLRAARTAASLTNRPRSIATAILNPRPTSTATSRRRLTTPMVS